MSVITSSNRSPAEWRSYTAKRERTSLATLISESPHIGTAEVTEAIARHAITPAGPFGHVIAVDECGAPIHANTIGADITLERLSENAEIAEQHR